MRTGSLLALAALAALLAYSFAQARGVDVTLEGAAPLGPGDGDARLPPDAATDQTYSASSMHRGDPTVRH